MLSAWLYGPLGALAPLITDSRLSPPTAFFRHLLGYDQTYSGAGRLATCNSETDESQCKQWAMGSAGRSEWSGKARTHYFVSRSVCDRLTIFFFCVLPWTFLVGFQDYHEPYSECNQKYQLTFSSIQNISLGASSVHKTCGGTLQTFLSLKSG